MEQIMLVAQEHAAGEVVGGILSLMVVFWIFAVLATVFWLWMLVDALTNETRTDEKILWFLVIFLLHFVGALIYFVVRRSGRSRLLT